MSQTTLLPLPGDLPNFETALQNLDKVPEILYRALECAASKTSDYKTAEFPQTRLDALVAAGIFRSQAIKFLMDKGIDARADGCHWEFKDLPFAGISFFYNNQHIRILKGPDGVLPGCGHSGTKKKFYSQIPTKYLIGNKPMRSKVNYVVLWDFAPGYILERLWLALPARGGERVEDVSAYWCESLPYVADAQIPKPEPAPAEDGLEVVIRPKTEFADTAKAKSNAR